MNAIILCLGFFLLHDIAGCLKLVINVFVTVIENTVGNEQRKILFYEENCLEG